MAKNPKRALEAATDCGETVCGVLIRPLTLGLAAALEKCGSPLLEGAGGKPPTVGDMMASAFVLSRPAAESCRLLAQGRGAFDEAVIGWLDTLPPSAGAPLAKACLRAAGRVAGAAPAGVPDDGGPEGNGRAEGTAG